MGGNLANQSISMKRTGVCYTQATLDTIGGNPAIDVFMSVVNKSVLLVPPVYRWRAIV